MRLEDKEIKKNELYEGKEVYRRWKLTDDTLEAYPATITSIKPNDKKPGLNNDVTIRYREGGSLETRPSWRVKEEDILAKKTFTN